MTRKLTGLLIATILVLGWSRDGVCGTTGKIAGQVTDTSGSPLPGANVVIVGAMLGDVYGDSVKKLEG